MRRSKKTRYSITPSAISSSVGWHSQTQRLTPARICDDRYHTNLVRTAPLLRACMILGKDECG